jgi:hypothetical protein
MSLIVRRAAVALLAAGGVAACVPASAGIPVTDPVLPSMIAMSADPGFTARLARVIAEQREEQRQHEADAYNRAKADAIRQAQQYRRDLAAGTAGTPSRPASPSAAQHIATQGEKR